MFKIDFINVGYGDSILLRKFYADGKSFNMLVDTGELDEGHYLESDIRIKTVDFIRKEKIDRIDLLVITHLHKDHVGGLLDIAEQIHVGELWVNYAAVPEFLGRIIETQPGYAEGVNNLIDAINCYNKSLLVLINNGTIIKEIIEPFRIDCCNFFTIDVICGDRSMLLRQKEIIDGLYMDSDMEDRALKLAELDGFINNTSIVLNISCNHKKVLLGADACVPFWEKQEVPCCDILKLPHHGHKDGINKNIAMKMNPRYVVISTSNTRRDDCPSKEIIEAMHHCDSLPCIMCTDAVNMPPFFHGVLCRSISFNIDGSGSVCFS